MARVRGRVSTGRGGSRSPRKPKEVKKPKRGAVAEESMSGLGDQKSPYINKIKIERPKQKMLITFPMTDDGTPLVKSLEHFEGEYNTTLSDGKWHKFQMPEDDDLYEACLVHKDLKLVTTRFALVAVYVTDDKAVPTSARQADFIYAWMKISDFNKNNILDVIEESADESVTDHDVIVKLTNKDNALKMQEYSFTLKGKSLFKQNKTEMSIRDFKKEAKLKWDELADRVCNKETDDVISALIDSEEKPKRAKRTKRKFRASDVD